ncbi:MAG: hypothetical protein ABIQ15_12960 [Nocardioides sp.]
MTRLLGAVFALLAACGGVLLVPAPAQSACTCTDTSTRQHAAAADAVFSGTVRETRKPAPDERGKVKGVFTYVIDAERVYKQEGTVVTETVTVASARSASACGLGNLPVGSAYVFFASARDVGFRAGSCGGSARASDQLVGEVENALGSGKPMVPDSAKPELVLTPVEAMLPQGVGRLAAPGAAVAILGLLGLVMVRLTGLRR